MSTTLLAVTLGATRRDACAAAPAIDVMPLAAAEPVWASLAAQSACSPYWRYGWLSAFETTEAAPARVAVARDAGGMPVAALPIVGDTRLGIRVGRPVGGRHVNFNLPLVRRDVAHRLDRAETRRLLRAMGRALGLDALVVPNVPRVWDGRPTILADLGRPAASPAWSLVLGSDPEAVLAGSMSRDARKKLRAKVRGLVSAFGPVVLRQAKSAEEIDELLAVFYGQKEVRFRQLGIEDPFGSDDVKDAIRQAALSCPDAPAVEIYGLRAGDSVVGVLGGAADARRLSGMFISFAAEAARFSPGEVLVTEVVREQCLRGREMFDLGVGDARYKRSICDTEEQLVDVTVPVTLAGRAYATAYAGLVGLKRRIKNSPRAFAAATRLRKALRG